jgi:hypothetical protein
MKYYATSIAALVFAFVAASSAQAEDVGQHPAVFAPRTLPAVNPSVFIVGHPASPRTRGGHANFDHPAVLAARAAAAVDANAFLVQPPASVHWTLGPAIDQPIALQ